MIYKVYEEGTGPREGGPECGLERRVSFKSSNIKTWLSVGPAEGSSESITIG